VIKRQEKKDHRSLVLLEETSVGLIQMPLWVAMRKPSKNIRRYEAGVEEV